MKATKGFYFLLVSSNIIFLLLYFVLSFNNRLAADDFHFVSNINKFGIFNGTWVEYNSWSTRFASVFFNHLILQLTLVNKYSLFIFGIFNLTVFTLAIKLLIKNIVLYLDKSLHFNKWFYLNISIYIVSIIFISTFRINETWFWLCASCTYLWSTIMLVLGVTWLISQNKNLWLAITACFAFAYIGGSCEPLALLLLIFLIVVVFLIQFNIIGANLPKTTIITRFLFAIFFCLSAFIILYLGNGNRNREHFFEEISLLNASILNIKMTGIIVLKRLPLIIPFAILLCSPVLFIRSFYKKTIFQKNRNKAIFMLTIFYFFTIYLFQLPVTYKTQDVAAYRALFPITSVSIVYFTFLFFLIGQNISINNKLGRNLILFSILLSCIFNGFNLIKQSGIVFAYSKAYDERILFLKQDHKNDKVIELPPLPVSGMIYSAEISRDTSHFSNQHLKNGLELNYAVKLK